MYVLRAVKKMVQNIQNTVISTLFLRKDWMTNKELMSETGLDSGQVRGALKMIGNVVEIKYFNSKTGKERTTRIRNTKNAMKFARWRTEHGY